MKDFKVLPDIPQCVIWKWDLFFTDSIKAFASSLITPNTRKIFSTLFATLCGKGLWTEGVKRPPFCSSSLKCVISCALCKWSSEYCFSVLPPPRTLSIHLWHDLVVFKLLASSQRRMFPLCLISQPCINVKRWQNMEKSILGNSFYSFIKHNTLCTPLCLVSAFWLHLMP